MKKESEEEKFDQEPKYCDRDICGKKFINASGAYIGAVKPPFYDRMIYCKSCVEYVRQQKAKTYNLNRKEDKKTIYSA